VKFSVVICTFNRRGVLSRTLGSVLEQVYATDYEVIVVVDGSTDGTTEWLGAQRPQCDLRIVTQSNLGLAEARNAGLRNARGQYVLFLDDDIIAAPDLITRHDVAHAGCQGQCVVFGPVLVAPESHPGAATWWTEAYTEAYVARLNAEAKPSWPRDMVMEANYSAPRTALLASGGNDAVFAVRRQSADWGLRLHARGLPFRYVPDAVVWQLFVKNTRGVVRDAWWYGKSEVLLSRRYPAYRPHAMMARLNEGSPLMRGARQLSARLPMSPEPMLRPASLVLEGLGRLGIGRRAAIRVLELRQGIPMLRGAVAEIGSWEALEEAFGVRLPVLLFHHVGPRSANASPGLTISPDKFRRTVEWLVEHGFTGIAPSQWIEWLDTGRRLPAKPVLLTFDDALADLDAHAFPVLREFGFSAGVYVVTRQIGRTNAWAHRGAGVHGCLSAEQLRGWQSQGIEFGAHSRTHPDLTRLPAHMLEDEVRGSREDLEDLLGVSVPTFAYPFGYVNAEVERSVATHFDLALSTDEGMNTLSTDRHMLRRTMSLPSDTLVDLAFRTRMGRSPLHTLRARLRLRTRLQRLLPRTA
jgi:glycosyltransferase involved in cell wall biosynthesis/peptidoglycan/xylan/chitin deacetylase (PgdA/CDA1 family)